MLARTTLLLAASTVALCSAGLAHAEDGGPPKEPAVIDSSGEPNEQRPLPARFAANLPALPAERTWLVPSLQLTPPDLVAVKTRLDDRAPLLAAGNAVAADVLIWSWSRFITRPEWAFISMASVKDNLNGPWVFDPNSFTTNQFAHPYQGNLSFNAARAAGLGFWTSTLYPMAVSTAWELFAETEKPAINDAITTPVAGIFLGEALFRVAGMILDGGGARPGVWRELGAAAVSPMVGVTRLETGDRYRTRRLELIPTHLELGATGSFSGRGTRDGVVSQTAGLAGLSLHLTYGLPVPGWSLREPFDHFDLQAGFAMSNEFFFNLAVRGLLVGRSFAERDDSLDRGFWGLWGLYEAFSPQVYRTSTSALGFGAIRQWAWSSGMAVSLTGIAGVGFGAAGADRVSVEQRDYHYGLNSVVIVDARLYAADRGILSLAYRGYHIGGAVSEDSKGSETLSRLEAGARLRVWGNHSVGLNVVAGARLGTFADRPDSNARFSQATGLYVYTPGGARGSGLRAAD